MAHCLERVAHVVADAALEVDPAAVGHLLIGRLRRAAVPHPRRVARFLQVHVEVDEVHDDLRMRLRLHRAAHHAEAEPRLAVLRDEGRDDGVEGPLARGIGIELAVPQIEQLAPALQAEPQSRRTQPRPEAPEVALDQRHHVAVLVRHREVNRVSLLEDRVSRLDPHGGPVRIDQPPPFRRVFFRDQFRHRDPAERRVGVKPGAILESQLLGFHEPVQVTGAPESSVPQVITFQHVEDLQGRNPLPAGRQFPQGVTPVVR